MRMPSLRILSATVCFALLISIGTAAKADFITIPTKQVTTGSPVFITQTSVFVDPNNSNTFRACVSFKNITQKPAAHVTFTFRFDDLLGNPIAEQILQRSGSFGPNVVIEGKMSVLGGNSDSFNNCVNLAMTTIKPNAETVSVTEVRFEDGTTWKKGDPLPGAQPTAAPQGAPASVNVNGAVGTGGSIGPAGGVFGTIAWVPGSRKMIASDVDEATQSDADYGALSRCNALNGGGTACKVVVQMSGAQNKCGAVALDEANGKFAIAHGASTSDTIRAAQDALVKVGGTLAADSIVTIVCSTK
jgi:hypothetical protein